MSFLADIYEQPTTIVHTAESVLAETAIIEPLRERLAQGNLRRIVISGMGSSVSVVYPSLLRLTEHGFDVHCVEAAELLHYRAALIQSDTLFVLISQSGRSAEIVPLLQLAQQRNCVVLGITNTPHSPLHLGSSSTLFLKAGDEASVSTKTYTSTLALLHILTDLLIGEPVDESLHWMGQLADQITQRLDGWHRQMDALARDWHATPFIEYLGRGYSTASAQTGALISKESTKLPTEAMNAGQFRHGPLELVNEHFTGILFVGEEKTRQLNVLLAGEILRHHGRLALLTQVNTSIDNAVHVLLPPCPAALLPLVEIVPIQLLCAELSVQRGFEAGHFRYIEKVTVHE
jgi:glutamine---fructose-6-phosphate transaminase (isomerizing)